MYIAETVLTLDDKASKALDKIIGKLELTNKAFMELRDTIKSMDVIMGDFSKMSSSAGTALSGLSRALSGMNTRLNTTETATKRAVTGMESLELSGLNTTNMMAGMTMQAERLNTAMASVAGSARAAQNATRGFGRGRGGMGGGGHGGGGGDMGEHGGWFNSALNHGLNAMIGIDIAKEGLRPGLEYMQAQSKFATVGSVSPKDQARAKREAERIASSLGVASPSDVLEDIWHVYGVSKSMDIAIGQAEKMARGEAVVASLGNKYPNLKGQERDISQSIMRAAEQTGNMPFSPGDSKGIAKMDRFMDNAIRMLAISGGNVNANQFQQAITFMRTGKHGKNEESLFADTAYFLAESAGKGGRTGAVGSQLSQFAQNIVLGNMNNIMAGKFAELEILPDHDDDGNKFSGMKKGAFGNVMKHMKARPDKFIKNWATAVEDPGEWIWGTVGPGIFKEAMKSGKLKSKSIEGAHKEFLGLADSGDPGAQMRILAPALQGMGKTLSDLVIQYMTREVAIKQERKRFNESIHADEMYSKAMQSLPMNMNKVNKEFETLGQLVGDRLQKPLTGFLGGVDAIVGGVNKLIVNFDKEFPHLATGIGRVGDLMNGLGNVLKWILGQYGDILKGSGGGWDWIMGGFKDDDKIAPKTFPGAVPLRGRGGRGGGGPAAGFVPPPPPEFPWLFPQSTPTTPPGAVPSPHVFPGAVPLHPKDQQSQGHGPVTFNFKQDFHGPADPKFVASATRDAVSEALARRQLIHNATSTRADGNWNTPLLNGSTA